VRCDLSWPAALDVRTSALFAERRHFVLFSKVLLYTTIVIQEPKYDRGYAGLFTVTLLIMMGFFVITWGTLYKCSLYKSQSTQRQTPEAKLCTRASDSAKSGVDSASSRKAFAPVLFLASLEMLLCLPEVQPTPVIETPPPPVVALRQSPPVFRRPPPSLILASV